MFYTELDNISHLGNLDGDNGVTSNSPGTKPQFYCCWKHLLIAISKT